VVLGSDKLGQHTTETMQVSMYNKYNVMRVHGINGHL